jgi:DNA repair exonuclease SbcCD ATPase subunit
MQVYAMKFHNFLRFGEKNNTIVFDISDENKQKLSSEEISMDDIYEIFCKDPVSYIKEVKERGLEKQIGIMGIINGNSDSSNGAGKSSIMEGICFANYEKIVRKTANKDTVEKAGLSVVTKINGEYPKDLKESYVEQYFEENGSIYRIKRGRTFSKNKKSHSPVLEFDCISDSKVDSLSGHRTGDTKDSISDVIKIDYDVFVNSQMFGQNDAGKYLTGTDKTKKEMLISLLRLENVVGDGLELIRKEKNKQDKIVAQFESNIKFIENQFCDCYKKYSECDSVVFNNDMPEKIHEILSNAKSEGQSRITKYNLKKDEINNSISKLLNDERIKTTARIKEDGLNLKKQKVEKENEKTTRIKELKEEIDLCLKEISEIESSVKSKQNRAISIQSFIDEVNQKIKDFDKDKIDQKLNKINLAKEKEPSIKKELNEALREKENIIKSIASCESKKNELEIEIKNLSDQIKDVNDGSVFTCDKCKSNVTKDHIISEIESNKSKVEKIEKEIKDLNSKKASNNLCVIDFEGKIEKINQYVIYEQKILGEIKTHEEVIKNLENNNIALSEIKKDILNLNNSLNTKQNRLSDLNTKIKKISDDFDEVIKEFNSKLDNIRTQYENAKEKSDLVEKEIAEHKDIIVKIDDSCKSINEKIGFLSREIEHFSNLKDELNKKKEDYVQESKKFHRYVLLETIYGLDGIQTRIINKYLPLLNIYVSDFLNILSNGSIMVNQYINDKSKIDLTIEGGSADSYEMLSGGEKMIVRLAVDIGLALLSFSRSSQKPEIICLDEIFGPLDNNNTDGVFRMLEKLQDEFSRVLIITHNPDIQKRIATNIIIEKDMGNMGMSSIKRIE